MTITVTSDAVIAPLWFWLALGGATILLLLYLFWYSLHIEHIASKVAEQDTYFWESLEVQRRQWQDEDAYEEEDDPADALWQSHDDVP